MLTIPPALATKSGTHRIPRAASSSAAPSPASWLLAAPAMRRQRSSGIVASSRTAPSGYSGERAKPAVRAIGDTVRRILDDAEARGTTPLASAMGLARARLAEAA